MVRWRQGREWSTSTSPRLLVMAITRDALIGILAEADPVGLIADGAPQDTYAAEADAILALKGVPTLTEITSVFTVSFSEPGACTRDTARWIVEEMGRRAG
jgi:hypothetical protein